MKPTRLQQLTMCLIAAVFLGGCGERVDRLPPRPAQADQTPPPATAAAKPADQPGTQDADGSNTAPAPIATDPTQPPAAASPLLRPQAANQTSPDSYQVRFETTKGPFVLEVQRAWAPRGADRLYNLVRIGYFQDLAFFRAIDGFMVQFGIHGDPAVNEVWSEQRIPDDAAMKSNKRGHLTFATSGKDSRTTQMFINFGDNAGLDNQGFSPVGRVVQGMSVVDSVYKGYGDGPSQGGAGPDQGRIQTEGNAYLKKDFPELDYIRSAVIVDGTP